METNRSASVQLTAGISTSNSTTEKTENWDPSPVSRFYVSINGVNQAVFTEIAGLQLEVDVMPYEEGGFNTTIHRLPGRIKSANLTLKKGLSRSNDFLRWLLRVASGSIERKDVSVVLYDVTGQPLLRWDFIQAFPFKWSCNAFRADSTELAIETLELAYAYMSVHDASGK